MLDLAKNDFGGELEQFAGLNSALLKVLDLEENQVGGSIPDSFSTFLEITGLSLSGNRLTGTLPEFLGSLVKLRECTAASNQIHGPIPNSLGRLVNLNKLRLDDNQLTGTIPASLSNLNQLTAVYLLGRGNDLDGPVPEELRNDPGRIESDLTMSELPSPAPVTANVTVNPTPGPTMLIDVERTLEGPISLAVWISFIVLGVCVVFSCCSACHLRPRSTTTEERVPIKRSPQPNMSNSHTPSHSHSNSHSRSNSHSPAQIQIT